MLSECDFKIPFFNEKNAENFSLLYPKDKHSYSAEFFFMIPLSSFIHGRDNRHAQTRTKKKRERRYSTSERQKRLAKQCQ